MIITSTESRTAALLAVANHLASQSEENTGVFVDLPNGNKGIIQLRIIDTEIPTGHRAPEKIVGNSYLVDVPELKIGMGEFDDVLDEPPETQIHKLHNPVTGMYYPVVKRTSKGGKKGEIKGLWSSKVR